MSRSYSRLSRKDKTNKYHKKQSRKIFRRIEDIGNYSSTTKKYYQSWYICDYKHGGLPKVGSIVKRGTVNIKWYNGELK